MGLLLHVDIVKTVKVYVFCYRCLNRQNYYCTWTLLSFMLLLCYVHQTVVEAAVTYFDYLC